MGLVAGSILAGVALLWVATRPGLAPRPQPILSLPEGGRDLPGIAGPVTAPEAGSAAQTDRPRLGEPRIEEQPAIPPVFRPPSTVLRDLSSGSPNVPGRRKTEPAKTTKYHVVRSGETLSSIAQQYYGSANDWRKIVTVNETTIKDANKIAPGTRLIIPE
jgi:5'-nucleotidase